LCAVIVILAEIEAQVAAQLRVWAAGRRGGARRAQLLVGDRCGRHLKRAPDASELSMKRRAEAAAGRGGSGQRRQWAAAEIFSDLIT